jgi:flagellar FliL protein
MAEKKHADQSENEARANTKLFIIFGSVALILIIGVGIGAYYVGAKTAATTPVETQAAEIETKPVARPSDKQVDAIGPLVPIDEFLVNLLDKDNSRYLKATMTLEVDQEEAAEEIRTRMPQIRDAILLLTSNKTYAELQDLQGKMQLRAELIGHLNTLIAKGQVKHIYITNFVIQ